MFIKTCITKRGEKKYYHYQIVQSVWENGKSRHKVLANLGTPSERSIDSLIKGLNKLKANPISIEQAKLSSQKILSYGEIFVIEHIWNQLELTQIIEKHIKEFPKISFDIIPYVKLMVAHHVMRPGSELSLTRWYERTYFGSLSLLDYQKLLRSLHYLYRIKDEIEKDLFEIQKNLFNLEVDLVFYDITSTYFEGVGSSTSKQGYSRDKRPDRPQLLLTLAVTQDGLPIGHEVLSGNIQDGTTVKSVIDRLKVRFSIKQCIFVGDRGMVSEDNIIYIKESGYEYIFALKKRRLEETQEVLEPDLTKYQTYKEVVNGQTRELKYVEKTDKEKGCRYIICHNEEIAEADKLRLEKRIKKIKARIEKIKSQAKDPDKLIKKAAKIYLIDRFFKYGHKNKEFFYEFKGDALEYEKLICGKFVLKTDNEKLTPLEVIESYKNLQIVEDAFKDIKSFVEIRPIYHRSDEHVRGHMFVAVLAYLIKKVMERYFARADQPRITAQRILEYLSDIKAVENNINGKIIGTVVPATQEVKNILAHLNIKSLPETVLINAKSVKLPPITARKLKAYQIPSK